METEQKPRKKRRGRLHSEISDIAYKTCHACGTRFTVACAETYAWRLSVKGTTRYFCRYNCMRAIEREQIRRRNAAKLRQLMKYAPELRAHLQAEIEAEKGGGKA